MSGFVYRGESWFTLNSSPESTDWTLGVYKRFFVNWLGPFAFCKNVGNWDSSHNWLFGSKQLDANFWKSEYIESERGCKLFTIDPFYNGLFIKIKTMRINYIIVIDIKEWQYANGIS